jgi:16S rRNA (uracil1498-N3)-methyltransferase
MPFMCCALVLGKVELANGNGDVAWGTILTASKKEMRVRVDRVLPQLILKNPLHLALALPKPSTLEEVVLLASELGVHTLSLFRSAKCQSKAPVKLEKCEKIAREALRINKASFATRIRLCEKAEEVEIMGQGFLCDESPLRGAFSHAPIDGGSLVLNSHPSLLSALPSQGPVTIVIGPEASFNDDERIYWRERGFKPVGLGPLVLRVPTAVSMAVSLAQAKLNG